jgi:hypothetical protein
VSLVWWVSEVEKESVNENAMTKLTDMFEIDESPLESDFDNLKELQNNMESFMKEHPNFVVFPADNPGFNESPKKLPRLGWCAYDPDNDNEYKMWTITLGNVKKSHHENFVRLRELHRK